jgi:mRNA interferase MazF
MEKPVVGDVVVVPFPFTDLERAKRRPALVLADGDYIFCQITSRAWLDSVSLCPTDFTEGSLPHNSYVRPEKLYTGNQTVVLSRAGHLTDDVQEKIHRRLLALFQALDHRSHEMNGDI